MSSFNFLLHFFPLLFFLPTHNLLLFLFHLFLAAFNFLARFLISFDLVPIEHGKSSLSLLISLYFLDIFLAHAIIFITQFDLMNLYSIIFNSYCMRLDLNRSHYHLLPLVPFPPFPPLPPFPAFALA